MSQEHPYEIGKNYFIRTVTMYITGKLEAVYEHELVLSSAAWIAEVGRFADAMKSIDFEEVEPFPDGNVIVGRGAIIDAIAFDAPLPREQK